MNIVREQREQNTSLIKVTVGEQDYAQEVDKALREYKRKANIPGFRPGMVPMGIIKKMYGKGVLAEQSYRKASNAVFEYLQKENIDYLGDVIPSEEQGAFDFDNGKEFEFVFEIGEAPEIKLDLSEKDKLTYHKIKIEKKMHDDYRSNFLRRFGRRRIRRDHARHTQMLQCPADARLIARPVIQNRQHATIPSRQRFHAQAAQEVASIAAIGRIRKGSAPARVAVSSEAFSEAKAATKLLQFFLFMDTTAILVYVLFTFL